MNKNPQNKIEESETNWEEITENGKIGYGFIGKSNALRIARRVKPRVLKEILELGINANKENKNLVIEGDNLMSMATLYQYYGKIDLILTDPPYNTGEDFRYNDKWDEDPNDPGIGNYVKADDSSKHTKWLKFMVPRLQLIRKMLKPGGVLAICIDERELSRLLPLLDEQKIMFGEENRIAIINWEKATPKNDSLHVSNTTEYILVYAKKEDVANTERLERPESLDEKYTNPDNDPLGRWIADNPSAKRDNFGSVYAIQNPFTGSLLLPPSGRSWGWQKSKIKNWLEEYGSEYEEIDLQDGKAPTLILKGANKFNDLTTNSITEKSCRLAKKKLQEGNWPRLVFSQSGQGRPGIKRYLNEVKPGVVPTTYWKWEELGSISLRSEESGLTTHGTKEIIERVGEKFVGSKPLKLLKKIIRLWCPLGGLVCDPFAGSGTVGEAVLELNEELRAEREREREREREQKWSFFSSVFYSDWARI